MNRDDPGGTGIVLAQTDTNESTAFFSRKTRHKTKDKPKG